MLTKTETSAFREVLAEFIEDVERAYGHYGESIEEVEESLAEEDEYGRPGWPDLAITYRHAKEVLAQFSQEA